MFKTRSLFLFVLFSFFALQAGDNKHKNCERKQSWTEFGAKVLLASVILTYTVCPLGALTRPYTDYYLRPNKLTPVSTAGQRKTFRDQGLPQIQELLSNAFTSAFRTLKEDHIFIPQDIIFVTCAQGLANLVWKCVF